MTGIDMTHVPYKGRATRDPRPARRPRDDDVRQHAVEPAAREGGQAAGARRDQPQRSPAAPEIPTIAEQGLPGFDAVSWFALFAPAGTPKPIIDRLQGEVKKILASPDVAKKLAEAGLDVVGSTPDELAAYQRAEIAKWAKVVKDSGAKVE